MAIRKPKAAAKAWASQVNATKGGLTRTIQPVVTKPVKPKVPKMARHLGMGTGVKKSLPANPAMRTIQPIVNKPTMPKTPATQSRLMAEQKAMKKRGRKFF